MQRKRRSAELIWRTSCQIDLEDLINHKTLFSTIVVPLGMDGSANHACCIVDDLIFDATEDTALKLLRSSFDWITGGGGCSGVHCAIRFQGKEGLPGVKVTGQFKRNIYKNW